MATILIVDDRPTNRLYLMALLDHHGHRVLEASDGVEALEIARAERPDLVITDIQMPRMDGIELARRLAADPELQAVPRVFYTAAYEEREARALARETGVPWVIVKPAESKEVLRVVGEALAARAAARPAKAAAEPPATSRELAEGVAEAEAVSARFSTIIDLGLELMTEGDPVRLLDKVAHVACGILGAEYAALGLLDAAGQTLEHHRAYRPGGDAATPSTARPPRSGIIGEILADRRPRRLDGLDGDATALGLAPDHPPVRSFLGLAVATPSSAIGWIYVTNKRGGGGFTTEDERLAATIAVQLGSRLANVRLEGAMGRHALALEREVEERRRSERRLAAQHGTSLALAGSPTLAEAVPRCLRAIGESFGWDTSCAWALDREAGVLRHLATWHAPGVEMASWESILRGHTFAPGAGLPGRVWESRRPEWVVDVRADPRFTRGALAAEVGLRSGMVAPVFLGDEFLGVVEFYSREARAPDEEQLEVMRGITSQIGQFIERRRAKEALLERTRVLALAADVGAAIGCGGALREMLDASCQAVVRRLDAALAGVWTLNSKAGVLELQASAGLDAHLDGRHARVRVGELEVGRIALERAPRFIDDATGDAGGSDREWARGLGLTTFAGYPLLVQGELVGVLAMFSKRRLGEATLDGLGTVADTIALGIRRKMAETAQAALEQQLRQSQKMEAVGRLAGGVAHDFNNLLTAITGYGDLALMTLSSGDPLRRDIELMCEAALRAAGLTAQLLAFSRKQTLAPKVIDLNGIVRNMENLLRRLIGEDVAMVTVLDPALAAVRADAGQMEQVIMNLAVNARDAMPGGGKLTLETANVHFDEAYVATHAGAREGPHVLLAVSDAGSGMSAEVLSHLFEPFFTTKEDGKGTGLGLSTIYGIVKQSDGHVSVYSEVGHGTTFKVYLPAVKASAGALEPRPATSGASLRGAETILLVEDEEIVRELGKRVLERYGYTVIAARSGGDALVSSERQRGAIPLLITDVVMPGMSGRELAERLCRLRPGLKVLYLSGYTAGAISQHQILERGEAFLQKPFSPEAFGRKVREVLDAPGTPKQG